MAHTLRFSYGEDTYDFNSGSATLRWYVPETPNISTIDTNTILQDGGKRTLTTRRNVTENCQIMLKPSSGAASDIQAAKHTIQQWLMQAEQFNETGSGSRVYVEYAPDGLSASVYRSELFGGKVNIGDDSLDTRWTDVTLENSGCTSTCATVWNQNPTDYTGQSGCMNNWVQIAGSSISGEIRTPAWIEIHNKEGDTGGPSYHVFHGIGNDITDFPTVLEGENMTNTSGNASNVGSACHSSGSYATMDLFEHATWQHVGYFDLPSASLQKWAGRYMNVMCFFPDMPTTAGSTFLRTDLITDQWSGLVTYSEGQTIEVKENLNTLGTVRMPSMDAEGSAVADQRLNIRYKKLASGTEEIAIDCIHLMPTDGYRYATRAYTDEANNYLVDDGYRDTMYNYDSGCAALMPIISWRGNPIMLSPEKDQRLYLLTDMSPAAPDAFWTHGIKVKYRPRRLTI